MFLVKQEHFRRASDLLAKGDPASLRYCCLELRFCLEFIAYEAIEIHEKELPEEVFKVWQPKKVIEELLAYDPDVEQDFTLAMGLDGPNGEPPVQMHVVGSHAALARPFVRKHYSKLGNFLHAPTIGQLRQGRQKTTEDLQKYLEEILPQVERLCASTLQANLGAFSNLKCECCGTTIVRNVKSLAVGGLVVCTKTDCRAEYTVTSLGGEAPLYQLSQIVFECLSCKAQVFVEKHRLTDGVAIRCHTCEAKIVARKAWVAIPGPADATGP